MAMILLWFAQVQGTLQGGAKVATPTAAGPPTLLTVTVSPATISVTAGNTTTFSVLGTYNNGSSNDVTTMCNWSSSNPSVANIAGISSPQIVNALTAGTAAITCSVGNITDTAQITVSGLTITSPMPSLAGVEGSAFTATFVATGGTAPYTFSVTAGLSGLTGIGLSFTSPTLAGTLHTPSAGTYSFTVTAHDSGSLTTSRNFVLSVTAVGVVSRYPQLPQFWANPHEADLPSPCDVAHNCYTKHIPGDYPCTFAGLQASMTDWAAAPNNVWWHVIVEDGFGGGTRCAINATAAWQYRPKTNGQATGFIVYESSHPNVRGRTVCNRLVPATLTIAGPSPRNNGCATNLGIDDIQHMWKLTATSGNGAISSAGNINVDGYGAANIVVRDAEITTSANTDMFIIELTGCAQTTSASICALNGSSSYLTPRTVVPTKLGFEYDYIHGTAGDNGRSVGNSMVAQALRIGSQLSWAEWNYFDKISRTNSTGGTGEGQAITASAAWRGIKIAHNFVEGGEETIMMGGARPFFWANPADIEVRGNIFTMNPAWMTGPSSPFGNVCLLSKKNVFEIKLGFRFLIDGNVVENSIACAQYGQVSIQNMPGDALQSPVVAQGFPGANITNITWTNNVFRHGVNGYQGGSRSPGSPGNGDGVGHPMKNILFRNNLFYDINNNGGARKGTTANVVQMGNGQNPNWLCTAVRDSTGQTATLQCENNQITVCTSANPPVCQTAGPSWNTNLNTDPGNLVSVKNCTPASFNVQPDVAGTWPLTPALPGTSPVNTPVPPLNYLPGRTLVYHSVGPANETGTGCILRVSYGSPFNFSVEHNTFVFNGEISWPAPMGANTFGGVRSQDSRLVDNVVVNTPTGGNIYIPSNGTQGYTGQTTFFDANSLEWHHLYFSYTSRTPTQSSTQGIRNFPGHGTASFQNNQNGNTLWMGGAGTQICPDATATVSCLGMHGLMNGTTWIRDPDASTDPLVFFSLVPTSVYKAGGARQASDGTDMGADMEHIRHALQRTIYDECSNVPTAPNYCGPTGPYPD